MFSVLIPVQNYDVSSLVKAIISDSANSEIPVEIIVSEDGSEPSMFSKNAELHASGHIKHLVFEKERGRSANRNGLAAEASNDYLLFIDADSAIRPGFLKNYANSINKAEVLVGGTAYSKEQKTTATLLRWRYGIRREMISASERNKAPYNSLTANNLCVKKSVFLKILFDESITRYGHEDTLFGFALRDAGTSLLHIDNSVLHLGLESNGRFVEKTYTGIQTLVKLYKAGKVGVDDVRLLRFYYDWNHKGLGLLLNALGSFIGSAAKKNLLSGDPKLSALDFYKLVVLHNELK